ncbi:GNAT family N-acetyltransferase [Fructobacillus cardui]|uniref:GNAT family N-acetyltransferase n=1 Tax=Fructobacillus cardui TaxID=2893170 RepID=UPI002596EA8D|nr:GNAT family N-acetyltransferase [uncultured Fructobacillus sp.]CAK1225636.1 Ribosomal protein S18 acetylase RimI and related acetyltransferases (RimI) [Fructobacillus cardui]
MKTIDFNCHKAIFTKFKATDKDLYDQSINLRNAILRQPYNKPITTDEMLIEKNNQFYGITIDHLLIATFSCYQIDAATVRLVSFAVAEQYQHHRIGSTLLKFAIDDLKKQGYHCMTLSARTSAHEFYLKQEFKDTGKLVANDDLGIVSPEMEYCF